MGALSNYLEKAILDHTLAGLPYTPPAAHYVGLHTATPGESGAAGTEVAGGSYQRALAQFGVSVANSGISSNTNTLAYSSMPATTVTHISVWDQPTGGNMLYYGTLNTPVTISAGGTFVVNAGGLSVTLD